MFQVQLLHQNMHLNGNNLRHWVQISNVLGSGGFGRAELGVNMEIGSSKVV